MTCTSIRGVAPIGSIVITVDQAAAVQVGKASRELAAEAQQVVGRQWPRQSEMVGQRSAGLRASPFSTARN